MSQQDGIRSCQTDDEWSEECSPEDGWVESDLAYLQPSA
jgi:hypothetical protein